MLVMVYAVDGELDLIPYFCPMAALLAAEPRSPILKPLTSALPYQQHQPLRSPQHPQPIVPVKLSLSPIKARIHRLHGHGRFREEHLQPARFKIHQ